MSAQHQLDERARSGFRQAFGYPPGAVAVAPGRINIIGEHTDYNEGFVLPAAIDRHIAVALRLRRDPRIALRSLRDATEADLPRIPNPVDRRRAQHVVTENSRVLEAADALRRRSPRGLGPLLYASHESLRLDFAVGCRELDCLVELAAGMPQVIGARMMGGGFGGCVLVLVEAGAIDDVQQHLADGYADEFHKSPEFHRVRSVDGVMPERMI